MRRGVLALFLLAGCVTNPYTGRSQFLVTSESEEVQLGEQTYQEMLSKVNISASAREVDPVRRVGGRLAAVANKPDYQWEFNVIVDDETLNAWCLPGGKIAFYTGIFPALKDEAGLAFVMGHEISHALLRHGGERMSQNMAAGAAGALLGAALGSQDPETKKTVMTAFGVTLGVGVLLPFSRSHESEADALGLELMAKAGYDPRAGVEVWKRMAQLGGGGTPEFMSTHPSHETRIRDLEARMPQALAIYKASSRQSVAVLPKVGGRKGRASDSAAAAGLTASAGTVSVKADGTKAGEVEGGLKAVAFRFSFTRDVFVRKVRVRGPGGVDLSLDAGNGITGGTTRQLILHRTKPEAPGFPAGKYTLSFGGSVSGRTFSTSASYDVR